MTSILGSTKNYLGLDSAAAGFDPELITLINGVLSDLHQLGIGPEAGFAITDDTASWSDFMGVDPRLNSAVTYLHLSVKMLFDPPQLGYLITSYEKRIEQAAWRLTIKESDVAVSVTGGTASLTGNTGDEYTFRLTNPDGQTLINSSGSYEAEFISDDDSSSTSVDLDTSQVADGVLLLPVVIANGKYVVRMLSPRRTLLTLEVTAR